MKIRGEICGHAGTKSVQENSLKHHQHGSTVELVDEGDKRSEHDEADGKVDLKMNQDQERSETLTCEFRRP